jgi:hypothetical protein
VIHRGRFAVRMLRLCPGSVSERDPRGPVYDKCIAVIPILTLFNDETVHGVRVAGGGRVSDGGRGWNNSGHEGGPGNARSAR